MRLGKEGPFPHFSLQRCARELTPGVQDYGNT